jgi:hypothetical protein
MTKRFVSELTGKSGSVIPKNGVAVKRLLADLDRDTAIFGLGVAFLGAQITNLENRCVAIHGRLKQKRYFTR